MNEIIEITALPEEIVNLTLLHNRACQQAQLNPNDWATTIVKSSIDARKRPIYRLQMAIHPQGENPLTFLAPIFPDVQNAPHQALIIGAGPAGLFAALKLIQLGIKPIIWERGKNVKERRRDLATITRNQSINPESNYCFGEGGAGTYSDGKLYTRSTKRGDVRSILQWLVHFGADQNILIQAHPHIGTNKLPQLIANMREQILASGGEVHFNTKFKDVEIINGKIVSARNHRDESIHIQKVILATGHSARDIFEWLNDKKLAIEFKSFALGVRVEHPQSWIDQQQYHCEVKSENLPPAAYSWVEQVNGRGVYSFCMCPGGIIAPCATGIEEVVTNGWSPSKRNNPWANSGIVVPIQWEDIPEYHAAGPLAGLRFQQAVEKRCWIEGGQTQQAPAQRLVDFVQGRISKDLPSCSYLPGVVSRDLNKVLPSFIAKSLQQGFLQIAKKMKGYLHESAILVAPESRTSSPVRIPRDKDTLQHPECEGLYPCGEGAGYAGGIISAAIDGVRIAETLSLTYA
ncbi:MAG: hypothetical protein RL062_97 [Bacteroidota bacterium]|jgi:uncharacterized FAD-dependent dehydrogenase